MADDKQKAKDNQLRGLMQKKGYDKKTASKIVSSKKGKNK